MRSFRKEIENISKKRFIIKIDKMRDNKNLALNIFKTKIIIREGKKETFSFFFSNLSKKAKLHPPDPKRQNNFQINFLMIILEI